MQSHILNQYIIRMQHNCEHTLKCASCDILLCQNCHATHIKQLCPRLGIPSIDWLPKDSQLNSKLLRAFSVTHPRLTEDMAQQMCIMIVEAVKQDLLAFQQFITASMNHSIRPLEQLFSQITQDPGFAQSQNVLKESVIQFNLHALQVLSDPNQFQSMKEEVFKLDATLIDNETFLIECCKKVGNISEGMNQRLKELIKENFGLFDEQNLNQNILPTQNDEESIAPNPIQEPGNFNRENDEIHQTIASQLDMMFNDELSMEISADPEPSQREDAILEEGPQAYEEQKYHIKEESDANIKLEARTYQESGYKPPTQLYSVYDFLNSSGDEIELSRDIQRRRLSSGEVPISQEPWSVNQRDQEGIADLERVQYEPQGNMEQILIAGNQEEWKEESDEEVKMEEPLANMYDGNDGEEQLTMNELVTSLYYMPEDEKVMLLHIDPTRPEDNFLSLKDGKIEQEQLYEDSDYIPRKKFAQVLIQLDDAKWAVILFGIMHNNKNVYEYNVEQEEPLVDLLDIKDKKQFKCTTNLFDASFCTYKSNQIVITGGSRSQKANDIVIINRVHNLIKDVPVKGKIQANNLEGELKKLPKLKTDRYSHSSFIIGDWLFVIFGLQSMDIYNETVEFIKLTDTKKGFTSLPLQGESSKVCHTMLFQHNGEVFFFGGKRQQTRKEEKAVKNQSERHSILKKLKIDWCPLTKKPTRIEVQRVQNEIKEPVKFKGEPIFTPNVPNSRFLPEQNIWVFVDDNGNYYIFNPLTLETKHVQLK
ncbi:hypothetical protein FGO68_gene4358 [Halteria grandinella]|uniref:Uncharacterized protein n=1 Tax=Halteria grandinella TaxID=5974 RepID=A0A8J8NXV4_HALGN|nr:hypothetical protein FGO68_gene4358 [Halteria grandinella]